MFNMSPAIAEQLLMECTKAYGIKIHDVVPYLAKTILWKESLKIDDHQFHQYQQNKQSPLILARRTWNIPRHMTLEIQVLAWDRHTNVSGLDRLMGSRILNICVP